ncbi:MAG: MFS transporter [Anaerolineae bacterium]
MSAEPIVEPKHYTHNALCIGGESTLFGTGISFISASTVIPTLVAQLTSSPVMVGLAVGLPSGAWLLPQLFVAAWVSRFRLKRPVVALACLFSRPFFILAGLAVGFLALSNPGLALAALIICQVIFYMGDAVASVPWFDLFAKTIPPRRRGRVLGVSQIIGGVGGILAGGVVRYILGANGPWHYPWNYASLFFFTGGILLIGTFLLSLVREEPSTLPGDVPPGIGQVLRSIPALVRNDRPFAYMLVTRLVTGFISIATAFYVIYATKTEGLGTGATGLFLSAQVVGTLIAGMIMSTLQDRWGVLVYMRVVIAMAILPPVLAVVTGILSPQLGSNIIYPFLLVFCLLGIYLNSIGWPFFGWMLEHAPEGQRPLYIGVSNTLGTLTMLAPPLGGWLAEKLGYPAVFVTAIIFALAALILSFRLPKPGALRRSPEIS